jgi:hypothetical protein
MSFPFLLRALRSLPRLDLEGAKRQQYVTVKHGAAIFERKTWEYHASKPRASQLHGLPQGKPLLQGNRKPHTLHLAHHLISGSRADIIVRTMIL